MAIICHHISSLNHSATGMPILNDISCQIKDGEFVALLGLNGAGKSSLLKALIGLVPLKRGEIHIEDCLLTPKTLGNVRRRMGMIFQGGGLIRQLSALENVLCGLLGSRSAWQTLGGFKNSDRRIALDLLTQLGLEPYASQKVGKLSGGQQQRVAIARALIQSPQILLADEPITGLDVIAANQVMESLARLNQEHNLTIVTVLHDLKMAETFAKRAIILDSGKIAYDGSSQNLTQHFHECLPSECKLT